MKDINQFRKNGYDYRLLSRTTHVAIFEQIKGGSVVAYEVHKVRKNHAYTRKYNNLDGTTREVTIPSGEYLASNEEFGRYGWTFIDKQLAMDKYNELVKN